MALKDQLSRARKAPQDATKGIANSAFNTDGWENLSTGLGVLGADKRRNVIYRPDLITQEVGEMLWRGDDIAARIVETIPNEMLREGFSVTVPDDKDTTEEIDDALRELDLVEVMRQALYFANAFGGCGLLLGADDGSSDWSRPLNEQNIRSVDWLTAYSPRELQPITYYSDPLKPRFGDVATYRLTPLAVPTGNGKNTTVVVHESRIIRVPGIETTRLSKLANVQPGWGDSIFCRVGQVIADFQAAWQGVGILMQDFAVAQLKIKGLAEVLAGENPNDQSLATRARMLELCRSIARVAILDADEEYSRDTTNVTGLDALLDKLMLRLAAAANMPVSLLMGQAPAGLNATGDSDIRWFYDSVAALQTRRIRPPVKRVTELLLLSKSGPTNGQPVENWDVTFSKLWQLTEAETAAMHLTQAQADALNVANQIATPEEIGKSRFGGDKYSIETQIDTDLRDEMMDQPDHQEERLDPPPRPELDQTGKDGPGAIAGQDQTGKKG